MKRIFSFIILCALFPFFFAASAFAQTVTGTYNSFDGSGFTGGAQRTWVFDTNTGLNVSGNSVAQTPGVPWTAQPLSAIGADSSADSLPDGDYRAWSYSQYAGYDGDAYCGASTDLTTCEAYMLSWPSGYVASVDFTVGSGTPTTTPSTGTSTDQLNSGVVLLPFASAALVFLTMGVVMLFFRL